MSNLQRSSDSIQLDGGSRGLLAFHWHADRYQHFWSFADAEVQIRSIESGGEDHWPLSPPLQQIHGQSFGDGREVVFGVGMAGRGHWSASFTLVPELQCWIVELACRSAVEPARLLSSYEILQPGGSIEASDSHRFLIDNQRGISLEAIAPGTLAELTSSTGDASSRIQFQPSQLRGNASTIQWAFRLRVQ